MFFFLIFKRIDFHFVLFSTEIQLTGSFNPNILYKIKEKIRQKFSSILSSTVGHEKIIIEIIIYKVVNLSNNKTKGFEKMIIFDKQNR